MATKNRGNRSIFSDPRIVLMIIGLVVWLAGAVAVKLTVWSAKPLSWPVGLLVGKQEWAVSTTLLMIILLIGTTVAAFGLRRLLGNTSPSNGLEPYAVAASSMIPPNRLRHLSEKDAIQSGKRLAPILSETPQKAGLRLGTTFRGNKPLFLDWESTMLVIAGPRMGKTQAIALPAIFRAPGAVLVTSNKPDVFTDTRQYREAVGKVWLFDPQSVVDDPDIRTTMWWNPLGRVHNVPTALQLTGWLSAGAGNTSDSNMTNKYFQDEGEKLLAALILAAAVGGGDLKHVYDWLKDINTKIPVTLLRDGGFPDSASDLSAIQSMDAKQRDGVIGFARQPVALLSHDGFAQYVTPYQRVKFSLDSGLVAAGVQPGLHSEELEEFRPAELVASTDALYMLSMEGIGSAAGLTTALTGEVIAEALAAANRTHSGRLEIPLVAVLDEAANVCKLRELPDQYSHFGSRGIIPITIIQSPAQARRVWGTDGWEALKSAAAIKYYGGNCGDGDYLRELSTAIGKHDVVYTGRSYSSGHTPSTSSSVQREQILDEAELQALPKELAVIQSPGNLPVLARKNFFSSDTKLQTQISKTIADNEKATFAGPSDLEWTA